MANSVRSPCREVEGHAVKLLTVHQVSHPEFHHIVVTGTDRFEAIDEPLRGVRADVLRDDAGEIEWLRIGGRLLRPYADGAPIPELDELLRQRG